jgi:polyhydroxyalkanoate synthesis regulator phasin
MADKAGTKSAGAAPHDGVKRSPGHRAVDARDAIAELTDSAQEISLEAGTKVSTAMKDVIAAAAGIAGFAVESARDLVQFMVRRGQMTPEEADKLMREAELAHGKRPASERKKPTASEISTKERAIQRAKQAALREKEMLKFQAQQRAALAKAKKAAARKAARKSPAKKTAAKSGAKKSGGKKTKKKR